MFGGEDTRREEGEGTGDILDQDTLRAAVPLLGHIPRGLYILPQSTCSCVSSHRDMSHFHCCPIRNSLNKIFSQ